MDASPSHPEGQPPEVAAPGETLVVDADGKRLELKVLNRLSRGRFTAVAPRLRVRGGLRLYSRVYDETRAWRMSYEVEEAEVVSADQAQITLRVVGAREMGDERRAKRVKYVVVGAVQPSTYDGYTFSYPIHTIDVSMTGIAFECERAFTPGQWLDVSFADGPGSLIGASAEVVRSAPGAYGHTRTMCRFVELSPRSRERLEQLIELVDRPDRPRPAEPREPAAVNELVQSLRSELDSEDADDDAGRRVPWLHRRRRAG
jgi:hypothetical protein